MCFKNSKRKNDNINILKYALKKIIISLSTYFLMLSIVYANENSQIFKIINEARSANNLPLLQYSKILEEASKNEANYLDHTQTCSEEQNENQSLLTEKYSKDQLLSIDSSFNFVAKNIMCVNLSRSLQEINNILFSALFHRLSFLNGDIEAIGLSILEGKKHKIIVFNVGTHNKKQEKIKIIDNHCQTNENSMITYPWPNQQDFYPVFFPNFEVGNPISVQFNHYAYQHVEIISFSLTDAYGHNLETQEFNSKNDINKKLTPFDFAWFPLQPLHWGLPYSVKLIYKADGKVQEKKWSFKTKDYFYDVRLTAFF